LQGGQVTGGALQLARAFLVDEAGQPAVIRPRGRHDPCVLPRAVPIVEAMACLVLADHWLRWRGQRGSGSSA
jgi:chorismate synthase